MYMYVYIVFYQSTDVANSNAMELEGFKRCHAQLTSRGAEIKTITTDRNRSVAKYIREEWVDSEHHFDAWHIAKSMYLS